MRVVGLFMGEMPTLEAPTPTVKRVELAYGPYPLTMDIHQDPTRIRVVCFGRRGGKSLLAMMCGIQMMSDAKNKGQAQPRGLIVAPTNKMLRENWWTAQTMLKPLIAQSIVSEQRLILAYGMGQIDFVSTEIQGGAGRGAGYDWAVLDEASRIPKDAWESDIRPALADRMGRALIISTPLGLNWFYDAYQQGQQGDPAMKSWHASTLDCWKSRFFNNPAQLKLYEEEWELIKRTTSESKFREEYEAEFLAGEGQLFHLKPGLFRGELRDAVPGKHYLAGVDVARKDDWMVTAVVEVESQQLVGLARSRHQDWSLQKAVALNLLDRFPASQCLDYVDSTGVGDPIAQDFRKAGRNVVDVCFTPKAKSELVENLLTAIDQEYLGIPDQADTKWLIEELRQYECIRQPSGALKYGAPEGRHDDGVTALMLAAIGMAGEWRAPRVEALKAPWWEREDSHLERMQYEEEVRRFARRFPQLPVPCGPTDLSWTLMRGRN